MRNDTTWQRLRGLAVRPSLGLTVTLCLLVLIARKPDAFYNPQFWAEDGVGFYRDALLQGTRALWLSYASYLHMLPRLVAALGAIGDPRWAPAIFTATALLFTLYTAARTQSARCPLPRHFGTALAVVLVPDAYEVLLNVTNLQWVTFAAFVLVLISADPARWWEYAHDVMAVALFGLTGPFSVILAPLFVWRALRRDTRQSWVLAALCLVAAGIQAATVWQHPPATQDKPILLRMLLAPPGIRIGGSMFLGVLAPDAWPTVVASLLGIVTLAAVSGLALRAGRFRLERIWLAAAFAGLLVVSLYRCRYELAELTGPMFGARYFFPLQMFVAWLMFAVAENESGWLRRILVGASLWALAVNVPRLHEPAFLDQHWSDYAPLVRAGEAVTVPLNPEGWFMELPERHVEGAPVERRFTADAALLQVSSRGWVPPGGAATVGFIVGGKGVRRVLVRAVGPTLRQFGLSKVLSRPMLSVRTEAGTVVRTGSAWNGAPAVAKLFPALGAFDVPRDSADAAFVVELLPGSYSATVTGNDPKDAGEVLVEIYPVD